NFLFVNRGPDKSGNTRWEEIALQAEVGFSDNGQPRSGMGVDAADFNGDGWQDLFVANVDQEMFSLYQNRKNETFADVAYAQSVGVKRSRLKTSGGSYLSSHDPREVLGLGQAGSVDWIEIQWPQPSGRVERIEKPEIGKYHSITEGKGIVPA